MLGFYIWIILDLISNITWLIFSIRSVQYPMTFIVFMPATFKVLVGLEQIWLMIELIVQINVAKVILQGADES